jgi:PAS domain S-box-containing protein
LELWGLKRDGSKFPLEINLNPTRIEGKLFVIAFVTDTTSQKKQQKN